MPTATSTRPSARERLIASADRLFYEHGVHVVGIDWILADAGVSKASLYTHFGSKDALVEAYLQRRHDRREARVRKYLDRAGDDHRARLLALFDAQREAHADPTFRGCAFSRAAAESDDTEAGRRITTSYRAWQLDLLAGLARDAEVADPATLARRLVLVYDGAVTSAHLDGGTQAADDARAMAEALVDDALGQRARVLVD